MQWATHLLYSWRHLPGIQGVTALRCYSKDCRKSRSMDAVASVGYSSYLACLSWAAPWTVEPGSPGRSRKRVAWVLRLKGFLSVIYPFPQTCREPDATNISAREVVQKSLLKEQVLLWHTAGLRLPVNWKLFWKPFLLGKTWRRPLMWLCLCPTPIGCCSTCLQKGHSPCGAWGQHMLQLPTQVIQKEAKFSRPHLHNFTKLQLREQSIPGPRCNCSALKLKFTLSISSYDFWIS